MALDVGLFGGHVALGLDFLLDFCVLRVTVWLGVGC